MEPFLVLLAGSFQHARDPTNESEYISKDLRIPNSATYRRRGRPWALGSPEGNDPIEHALTVGDDAEDVSDG